jgi:hypothetical protein
MRRPLRVLALSLLVAPAARAATFDYPGAAPCDTTLQACVDGVPAGSVVQIVTNTPINESLTVTQSLTLTAGAGFTPVLNGFEFFEGQDTPTSYTISNLTVNGTISTRQIGAGAFDAHILGNTITNSSSFGVAIELDSSQSPPLDQTTFEVRGNTVTVTGNGGSAQCRGIQQGGLPASGGGTSTIAGNHVTVTGCGQGSGIEIDVGPGETLSADILRNSVVATDTGDGILARNFAGPDTPTTLTTRIIDNVVTGQDGNAGFPVAIGISSDGSQHISAQVINNTAAYNRLGIGVSGRPDLGATVTGVIANNIAAHGQTAFGNTIGIGIEDGFAVTNDHNLVFDVDGNNFTPGPGTVFADPRLVSTTDFHLQQGSPAVNAGSNAAVPGDVTTDIEGNARIQNGVVDIGAYESKFASLATNIPAASPSGLAAMAALLAAAGALALARRG